jgi:pimeloyl-ACP methyl ester carboxylesterase
MHPRILTTLVLLDPVVISKDTDSKYDTFHVARLSTWRRDIWPSQEEADKGFKKSKFYASWDPRVLDRWLQYGLRKLPTVLYPDCTATDTRVTLKTTKHNELFTFLRPNYQCFETGEFDRKNHPDVEPEVAMDAPFIRPESLEIFDRLPNVRPSVLYIFGGESDMSTPPRRKAKIDVTGTGLGGSGGAAAGRVKEVVLEGIGHLVAMEAVGQCADSIAEWVGSELKRWNMDEEELRSTWAKKSMIEKITIDDKWREMIGGPPGNGKPQTEPKL